MGNRWQEIWNQRKVTDAVFEQGLDEFAVYTELKKLDGYDVNVGDAEKYYKNFYDSAVGMWAQIKNNLGVTSIYEVGCGSGANLYLFRKRGMNVGGIDYSGKLVSVARRILGSDASIECGEATNITSDEMWDVLLSDGVFAYFPDEKYGEKVLEKMYEKAKKAVIITEVFDKEKEDECNQYRRKRVKDYNEKYEGLDKLFYSKDMFAEFAERHNCIIDFSDVENEQYWNSKYLFNCWIYKH